MMKIQDFLRGSVGQKKKPSGERGDALHEMNMNNCGKEGR